MKIANIVYEKELVNHTEVEYINYYKESIKYDNLNKTLPTLFVGWSFMKISNPNNEIISNANILHKKIIGNELYWECSFEESKSSHVRGIENFINLAPHFYFSPKYQYTNLDPVFFQIKDIDDLIDVLPKKIHNLYNYKEEMLYILFENKIWGVDLKMYNYFQFNINEIVLNIQSRAKSTISDISGDYYLSKYKIFPNFLQLKRYIVTF
jgi:hypothetical protein